MSTNILEYRNNWEADKYSVNGTEISELKSVIINGKQYSVESKICSIPYSDMGHVYTGTSKHFFVRETLFGMTMRFDLNKIVKSTTVEAVDYL
ncbi:MAG: hypothetical protein CTY12_08750 [Methylotenera sp.]|nr:MAG: hypothetical protein CTY12_08750 [Methylotenera sp.]